MKEVTGANSSSGGVHCQQGRLFQLVKGWGSNPCQAWGRPPTREGLAGAAEDAWELVKNQERGRLQLVKGWECNHCQEAGRQLVKGWGVQPLSKGQAATLVKKGTGSNS